MRRLQEQMCVATMLAAGALAGCGTQATKAVDVTAGVRSGLDQAGLADVKVGQDRDKGVVTLSGHVAAAEQKEHAEAIARGLAGAQVVANEIAVVPPGLENEARKVNTALDKGIEHNLEAALVAAKLKDVVRSAVNNRVVTLSGNVNSMETRAHAEEVAAGVPNVQQVVNELQIKKQRATSTN